jgi:hypothetical protein
MHSVNVKIWSKLPLSTPSPSSYASMNFPPLLWLFIQVFLKGP